MLAGIASARGKLATGVPYALVGGLFLWSTIDLCNRHAICRLSPQTLSMVVISFDKCCLVWEARGKSDPTCLLLPGAEDPPTKKPTGVPMDEC